MPDESKGNKNFQIN